MSVNQHSVCHEIKTPDEFAALRAEWDTLFAECSYPSPFCTWQWAWEWWQHFGDGDPADYRLLVALAYTADGTLIGLAPFFFPDTKAGPLRLRPLRPLATRIRCMVDDMTEEPIVLLHHSRTEEALEGVWNALRQWNGRERWDLLHLRIMRRASDPSLADLWRRVPHPWPFVLTNASRRLGQTRSLPKSWAEFRQSLSKSMRDNISYYPRLLTREGRQWSVQIARTPEDVALAVPFLIALHSSRAQSERGPTHLDHLPGRAQKQFLQAVLVRLSAQGMASVALLRIGGEPAAAQSVLETGGRMTFYYSGFNPVWHRYSPVTILQIALLQDAISRGVTEMDYLPEAEPWKTRWGTEAEYVFDELSCLSIHPRAIFRSLWRKVAYLRSRQLGSACACGFCTPAEQAEGKATAQIALAQSHS